MNAREDLLAMNTHKDLPVNVNSEVNLSVTDVDPNHSRAQCPRELGCNDATRHKIRRLITNVIGDHKYSPSEDSSDEHNQDADRIQQSGVPGCKEDIFLAFHEDNYLSFHCYDHLNSGCEEHRQLNENSLSSTI